MYNRVRFIPLLVCLLTLAACGGTTTGNSSPTATPTVQPTPTNTPPAGWTVYTSPDHKYQLSYPPGWQVSVADGNPGKVDFSGPNQNFEVSDNAGTKGVDPAQLITDWCNAIGQKTSQATGTPVVLAGQTWFKAQCGDTAQPSEPLIVEVVTYQGAVYQIDYSSPAASFLADDNDYYSLMEQSFQFLT
jgi:hypothetical protein